MARHHLRGIGEAISIHWCARFHDKACAMSVEGIVSKRLDAPIRRAIAAFGVRSNASTARNLSWSAGPIRKAAAPYLCVLLLAYYDPDGKLMYAGRVGTGIDAPSLSACAPARAASHCLDAARCPAVAQHPLRLALRSQPCPLGAARARRGSSFSPGPRTISFARWSIRVCARTSRRPRSGARCRMRSHDPNRVRLLALRTDRSARRRRQRKTASATMRHFAPGRWKLKFLGN